jgi:hypothetical protein
MNLSVSGGGVPAAAGGFCASQSWNTLTDFSVDFDHTTDNKQACYNASDGEVGTLNNSATIATPGTIGPVSGGDAVLSDADQRFIDFDNDTPYFDSKWGELYFTFLVTGDNTEEDCILNINHDANNRLRLYISASGAMSLLWEDNSAGNINIGGADVDDTSADWIQVHIKWDTTRCTDGDGNCGDANEDEVAMRWRIDDNRDGDFGDGGNEDWSAWEVESSTKDAAIWATEPGANDVILGIWGATHTVNIYVDDLEISKSQPSW